MKLTLLFLGAGKRLSLLERFQAAAAAEGIGLRLLAIEGEPQVPIASVAEIIVGPRFASSEFREHLLDVAKREAVDLVIPNMDAAVVALSRARAALAAAGSHAVVSEPALCAMTEDKVETERWFLAHSVPIPSGGGFPRIAKYRLGFGARDQAIVSSQDELDRFVARRPPGEYVVQRFVEGQEYTVDGYVSRRGEVLGALSRQRLRVVDGEVEVSRTHRHAEILALSRAILGQPGWEGPVTLQFIDSAEGPIAIEVNARFGGGVTHSIHCGLDMPRWVIREHLGRPVEPFDGWADGSLMTRCRRDIFL